MKKLGFLSLVVLISCDSPKNIVDSNHPTSRYRSPGMAAQKADDTIIITGVQKIPLLGRSENGILQEIEGTWQLVSINGNDVADFGGFDSSLIKRTNVTSGTLTRTKVINGVTTTETIIERPANEGKKITPAQSGHYHIPQKPYLSFYGSNETFSGFSGCNKLSGRYRIIGQKNINLSKAAASTRMACIGDYDENLFINTLHEVNSFKIEKGQLQFLKGSKVVLVFDKK
ncbi:MAG: META domain-containing protein [Chitinophagaceae bacterium]|nr:META domain-containing protein [Chitinophagaceae bacterium]